MQQQQIKSDQSGGRQEASAQAAHDEAMAELERRLDRLEAQNQALKEQVETLQHSSPIIGLAEIPSPTKRSVFNQIIREQVDDSELSFSQAVRDCYIEVYNDFLSLHGINLRLRAKNRELAVVEYAERAGFIDALLSLAVRKFGISDDQLRNLFEDELPVDLAAVTDDNEAREGLAS